MNWFLFYLLAALHPVAFIAIWFTSKSWKARVLLWALLPIPAVLYCWDYFVIKREHQQMCAMEGGLKVLIPPGKTDRLRLQGDAFKNGDSKALLSVFYPRLTLVESKSGEWDKQINKKKEGYFAYTVAPNPRVGLQSMTHAAEKEGPYIFPESRVESLDETIYEISEHESDISHGTRKETRLSRGGKVYAKYSEIVHWWSGIQYPDAVPTWRCPAQVLSPPIDEPNAPPGKWHYPPSPQYRLTEQILKNN